MDCDGGMFENSEGIVVGKDHVPGGSGLLGLGRITGRGFWA